MNSWRIRAVGFDKILNFLVAQSSPHSRGRSCPPVFGTMNCLGKERAAWYEMCYYDTIIMMLFQDFLTFWSSPLQCSTYHCPLWILLPLAKQTRYCLLYVIFLWKTSSPSQSPALKSHLPHLWQDPCPISVTWENPTCHLWRLCFIPAVSAVPVPTACPH